LSDDGTLAFVNGNGTLRSFTLNAATGAPTLVSTVTFATGSGGCGSGLAFAPRGSGLLRKSVSPAGPVCAGTTLTYRLGWSNTGSQTLSEFTITDTLPA